MFENNRLLCFPIVFWKFLWGDKTLMEGDKAVMGGSPQSPTRKNPDSKSWIS